MWEKSKHQLHASKITKIKQKYSLMSSFTTFVLSRLEWHLSDSWVCYAFENIFWFLSMPDLRRGLWARLWTRAQEWLLRGWSSTATFKGRRTGFWSSSSLTPAGHKITPSLSKSQGEREGERVRGRGCLQRRGRVLLKSRNRQTVSGILWQYAVGKNKATTGTWG